MRNFRGNWAFELTQARERGETAAELAARLGVVVSTVYEQCRRNGIALSARQDYWRERVGTPSVEVIRAAAERGDKFNHFCLQHGVSPGAVSTLERRAGVRLQRGKPRSAKRWSAYASPEMEPC